MSNLIFGIGHSELHQLAEYRLLIYEISNSTAQSSTKVALLQSLKYSLEVTLHAESKKNGMRVIQMQRNRSNLKGRQCLLWSREQREVSASDNMRNLHREIINQICKQFELRDRLTISLSQIQQIISSLSSKYQRQVRHNDFKGQAETVVEMRLANGKMDEVLTALKAIKESVVVDCEMLLDNIKLLKVKYALLKKELPQSKRDMEKKKGRIQSFRADSIEMCNQNRNQILVNL